MNFVVKDMLVRGLKRTDAQDHYLWLLDYKNELTLACWEDRLGSRKTKLIGKLVVQVDTDDDELARSKTFMRCKFGANL